MKLKNVFISIVVLFVFPISITAQEMSESTLDDQVGMELTVYTNSVAFVKDVRRLQLPKGLSGLRFIDIASTIMPETVFVRSLSSADSFSVYEQSYDYDLINENKLLDKYVGKSLEIIDFNEFKGTKETTPAVLLSNNGQAIYRIDDRIFVGHPGYVVLPELPEGLVTKPTLTWRCENKGGASQDIEVSYLADNISWKADYVMVLEDSGKSADMSAWVTIDNRSGTVYREAHLVLVAGQVNKVTRSNQPGYAPMAKSMRMMESAAMDYAAPPSFQQEALFEYHSYDLDQKTTVEDNKTKQINMIKPSPVKTIKEYYVYGDRNFYTGQYRDQKPKSPVNVFIKFTNSGKEGPGVPLPAGTIRVYQKDSADSLQFIGEDAIKHTPVDEEVKIKTGTAFDIVAERVQTDYEMIGKRAYETEWEITVRNQKKEAVTVNIVEPIYGEWAVLQKSHPFEKVNSNTIKFAVDVPGKKEVKVTYRVRTEM